MESSAIDTIKTDAGRWIDTETAAGRPDRQGIPDVAPWLRNKKNASVSRWQERKMEFAFISRHQPTASQHALAAAQGHTLTHVGDADAFNVGAGFVHDKGPFEGVVVVHPAAALRLASQFVVGVFENANRAPVGETPQFEAISFHVYDLRD